MCGLVRFQILSSGFLLSRAELSHINQEGLLECSVGGSWRSEVLKGGAWPLAGLEEFPRRFWVQSSAYFHSQTLYYCVLFCFVFLRICNINVQDRNSKDIVKLNEKFYVKIQTRSYLVLLSYLDSNRCSRLQASPLMFKRHLVTPLWRATTSN